MTKQDIIDYVVKTPHNTNKAVLSGMLDSVIGGGSSDLSIAKVTIINNSNDICEIYGAFGEENEGISASTDTVEVSENTTDTADVILYKGSAFVSFGSMSGNITFTGDITQAGGGYFVRGDGTIVIGGGGGSVS